MELQRRTQGKLEGGSFEWEGRGWGDGGTYGRDGRKVSLWEQETRLADARWPSQPREMEAEMEPHFRMGKGGWLDPGAQGLMCLGHFCSLLLKVVQIGSSWTLSFKRRS